MPLRERERERSRERERERWGRGRMTSAIVCQGEAEQLVDAEHGTGKRV